MPSLMTAQVIRGRLFIFPHELDMNNIYIYINEYDLNLQYLHDTFDEHFDGQPVFTRCFATQKATNHFPTHPLENPIN